MLHNKKPGCPPHSQRFVRSPDWAIDLLLLPAFYPPKEISSLDAHWTVRLLLFPDWLKHVLKDYPETNLVPRLT